MMVVDAEEVSDAPTAFEEPPSNLDLPHSLYVHFKKLCLGDH
jgi:hypothetical protein